MASDATKTLSCSMRIRRPVSERSSVYMMSPCMRFSRSMKLAEIPQPVLLRARAWSGLLRNRHCPRAPVPRAAEEHAVLLVEDQVGRHGVGQAVGEAGPARAQILALI